MSKEGEMTDPGNYRVATLSNTVGNVLCKLLDIKVVRVLEKEGRKSEGHTALRKKTVCVHHVRTYARENHPRLGKGGAADEMVSLERAKAYVSVWTYRLWNTYLSKYGLKGNIRRVRKKMKNVCEKRRDARWSAV